MSEEQAPEGAQKVEHLRCAIDYIEARIRLLNGECSVLIAVQLAQFALIKYLADRLAPDSAPVHLTMGCLALWSALVVFLLLLTIRPGWPWSRTTRAREGQEALAPAHIMWFKRGEKPQREEFSRRVDSWRPADYLDDLQATLYVCHRLVFRKYRSYSLAMQLVKWQVIFILAGILYVILRLLQAMYS